MDDAATSTPSPSLSKAHGSYGWAFINVTQPPDLDGTIEETVKVYARINTGGSGYAQLTMKLTAYDREKRRYLPSRDISATLTAEQARQLAEGLGLIIPDKAAGEHCG